MYGNNLMPVNAYCLIVENDYLFLIIKETENLNILNMRVDSFTKLGRYKSS